MIIILYYLILFLLRNHLFIILALILLWIVKDVGRRKRKIIRITKKQLPKVFSCPQCGMFSIRVLLDSEKESKIVCGSCDLTWKKENITKKPEAIDIYNKFVDEFVSGRG